MVAIRALLAAGADPGAGNVMGQTPLHIAALWANLSALSVLVAAPGAKPNARNKMGGRTPLHMIAARHDSAKNLARRPV